MDKTEQTSSSNIDDFIKSSLDTISNVMKCANTLPLADYDYWSIEKCFTNSIDVQKCHMINMIQFILSKHGFKNRLSETMDEEDILACITSICDQLMERINGNLDEASGKKASNSLLLVSKVTSPRNDVSSKFSLMTQKSIPKPQGVFKDKVDNSDLPFKPDIKKKPNALKSLQESLYLYEGEYSHPYAFELENLKVDPKLLCRVEPKKALTLQETPFTYIEQEGQLDDLIKKLKCCTEVAVDLEHHSFRSYQGFTCLMQLSTRHEDFIVDTLALRHHLHALNDVFTDPHILKVLHGSDCDIEWLQKDFSIYVVNSFDTGQAARLLQLPHFSLAYLLQTICHITADKQFQKADWRIRPLPDVYLKYAREDTHYLLYVYDVIKNMLIEREGGGGGGGDDDDDGGEGGSEGRGKEGGLLYQAFVNSNELCKKRYKKPRVSSTSHVELYEQRKGRAGAGSGSLTCKGVEVLRRLFAWRDKLARMEDESTGYILPNEIMFQIALTLPLTEGAILQCCKTYIPPTLKRQLEDVKIIVTDVVTFESIEEGKTEASDKTPGKNRPCRVLRNLPVFKEESFDASGYDDSFLKSKSKIDSSFDSPLFHTSKQTTQINSVLNKLSKVFLPYLPTELLPKDYKANFKVRFIANAPVEVTAVPKVIQPEVVETAEEIKLSAATVSLRTKIKSGKIASKDTEEKNEAEKDATEKSDSKTKKINNIGKIQLNKKSNSSNKNGEKEDDFQAKVYEKKELKGVLKEDEKKGKGGEKRSYDPNTDISKHPTAAKKTRKNFHKSNKSQSFMPQK